MGVLVTNSILYAASSNETTTNTVFFRNPANGRIKLGSTDAPTNMLDVDGNISLTTAGALTIRVLKDIAAGGTNGAGFYSNSASGMGFGTASGTNIEFVGIDGNTTMGKWTGAGLFEVGPNAGQNNGFSTNIGNFRKDLDGTVACRVENQSTGNSARVMMLVQGAPTLSPAAYARYMAMTVTSETFTGEPVMADTAILQSGGNIDGGMLIYPDSGAINITNYYNAGAFTPCIYVAPYSLDGVIQTNPVPQSVAIGHAAPTAFFDILPGLSGWGSFRLRTSATPTGGALVDGLIWQDGTDLKIRIGGATKTVTLT